MNYHSISIRLKEVFPIPRLLRIINTLLVILLIWVVGLGAARIVENTLLVVPFQPPKFVSSEKKEIDRPVAFTEFQSIIEQNVFDAIVEEKTIEAAPLQVTKAPGVNLRQILENLTLIGTVQRSGTFSLCVIKDKGKNQEELFAIGDPVFDTGAVVRKIVMTTKQQQVQIEYNGEIGLLTIETVEENTPPNQPPQNVSNPATANPPSQALTNDYSSDGKNFYISSEEVDNELNNFAALLNQARMVPYFRKGKHQGYQVKAIDKGSLYEKLGLRNRDIIEEINGQPLDSMEKVMGLFNTLRSEREFSVKVKRGGISQYLKYYIN